jgi:hypothetical protein
MPDPVDIEISVEIDPHALAPLAKMELFRVLTRKRSRKECDVPLDPYPPAAIATKSGLLRLHVACTETPSAPPPGSFDDYDDTRWIIAQNSNWRTKPYG